MNDSTIQNRKAYIVTGPTSGIGLATAFELAKHGTVILVGRNRTKLNDVQKRIEKKGGKAIPIVCDLANVESVRRAASEIIALDVPLGGLVNNAGIMQMQATNNAQGWDMSFATNHLGPFVFTDTLIPQLADGTNVVFVVSAVEDPERKPAAAVGFRGSRFISIEASARGEWKPGGSKMPGADAYATSKQCNLATALEFAREFPRIHFYAIEPGVNPTTSLGHRDAHALVGIISKFVVPVILPLLMPFMKFLSTPERAAKVITKIVLQKNGTTGVYYDESGNPIPGSEQVRDPKFTARVVAETREFLAAVRA